MNHPQRSRARQARIIREAERWSPILKPLSSYEAAERVLSEVGGYRARRTIADRATDTESLAGALLAVAGLALPDDGWRPIETAPKDGTPILGFMPSYYQGKGGVSVILWMPTGPKLQPGPDDGEWRDNRAWATVPTHWRPLPAPPEDAPISP